MYKAVAVDKSNKNVYEWAKYNLDGSISYYTVPSTNWKPAKEWSDMEIMSLFSEPVNTSPLTLTVNDEEYV